MAGEFPIAEAPDGRRKQWNGSAWIDLPNKRAAGAAYLPQVRGETDKSEAANFSKWRTDQEAGINSARSAISNAREMEGLLARQKTGGIYGMPVIGAVAGWADPEVRRMDSLSNQSARTMRQPGEGAISDFDARMFQSMTYGKAQPTETNKAIVRAQRVAADRVLERRAFADQYVETYGHRRGFDEAWDRYVDDNPIFDPSSERLGTPVLNAKRQNWRTYYGMERGPGDRAPSQAVRDLSAPPGRRAPTDLTSGFSKGQQGYLKLHKSSGGKPVGDKANPYVPRSLQELRALPPGSWLIDTDGSRIQKPR